MSLTANGSGSLSARTRGSPANADNARHPDSNRNRVIGRLLRGEKPDERRRCSAGLARRFVTTATRFPKRPVVAAGLQPIHSWAGWKRAATAVSYGWARVWREVRPVGGCCPGPTVSFPCYFFFSPDFLSPDFFASGYFSSGASST